MFLKTKKKRVTIARFARRPAGRRARFARRPAGRELGPSALALAGRPVRDRKTERKTEKQRERERRDSEARRKGKDWVFWLFIWLDLYLLVHPECGALGGFFW